MGYAVNESLVRADIFKPSGKWSQSVALDMDPYYSAADIHEAVKNALMDAGFTLQNGWYAVVLEPYHRYSHPIMLKA